MSRGASLLPKPAITAIAAMLAAAIPVEALTPDTRPASIRNALRIVASTDDEAIRMLLVTVAAEAYRISPSTLHAILRDMQKT